MTIATTLGLAGLALFVATTMTWFARANQVAIPDNRLLFWRVEQLQLCWALQACLRPVQTG